MMDFEYHREVKELQKRLIAFMDEHIYPNEAEVLRARAQRQALGAGADHRGTEAQGEDGRPVEPVPAAFQARARRACRTWNTRRCARSWAASPGRPRCSTARRRTPATWRPSSATAREEQKKQWLDPLLEGKIRSAFLMTEPAVASSDATNIQMHIKREGDDYVINGRKWWSSGAGDPRCKIYIVMGKTNPDHASRHSQQSMVLVPAGTQGHQDPAPPDGVRLRRRAARPHGNRVQGRARAGVEHPARRRARLRDRAGPPRTGPHPPLHALDRPGRARAGEDVQARDAAHGVRPHGGRAGRDARTNRRGAHP